MCTICFILTKLCCNWFVQEVASTFGEVANTSDSVSSSAEATEVGTGNLPDELLENQGIRIRRCPSTGPPTHAVGPFEFRLENEGNTPRNILEQIIWNKDIEVKKALLT